MRFVTEESRAARGRRHKSHCRPLARLGRAASNPLPHSVRNALLYALIACAILALPGAHKAARKPKGIYRDIAESVVGLIEGDPKSSFTIYEAALRRQSLLDYYLARFSKGRLSVDHTLRKSKDRPDSDPLKQFRARSPSATI